MRLNVKPTKGTTGNTNHTTTHTALTTAATTMLIAPTIISTVRITAPTALETSLSVNARSCTLNEPRTFVADIWRYGAKIERASKSIEK